MLHPNPPPISEYNIQIPVCIPAWTWNNFWARVWNQSSQWHRPAGADLHNSPLFPTAHLSLPILLYPTVPQMRSVSQGTWPYCTAQFKAQVVEGVNWNHLFCSNIKIMLGVIFENAGSDLLMPVMGWRRRNTRRINNHYKLSTEQNS